MLALGILLLPGLSASAQDGLPLPTGRVILDIVDSEQPDKVVALDMAGIESVGVTSFTTTTYWDDGAQTFEGVLLRDLLARAGVTGETVEASALNEYSADIPMDMVRSLDILIATRWNGERMPIRTRGPLWIVFPFQDLEDEVAVKARFMSVWQLRRLTVK